MTIEKKPRFINKLLGIVAFIAKDKKSAAKKFEQNLESEILSLIDNPYRCRKSEYFDDEAYRDLIYYGYTIIYKVQDDAIIILEIFKLQKR